MQTSAGYPSAGRTWILLADGRKARLLDEPTRGGVLHAIRDLEISDDDLYDPQDRPPRSFESVGTHRHGMETQSLHEKEEQNFLKRVASQIAEFEKHNAFDQLVLMAPPRALGLLHDMLPAGVKARITYEAPKDVVAEDVQAIRKRLADLRMPPA